MTKLLLKRQVIELRTQGKSYSEIKQLIKVSKSSLSLWLRSIPLTNLQLQRLKNKKWQAVETYRQTMKLKRDKKLAGYYSEQMKKWVPLSERELFIAGLFLYWGEGNKAGRGAISISNTDPEMLKFALAWMTNSLKLPLTSIKVALHLYSDMDVVDAINYWSKELNIPKERFNRPYIKHSLRTSIDQKGFGHGTCNLVIHNTVIKDNLLMTIKAISDFYSMETEI